MNIRVNRYMKAFQCVVLQGTAMVGSWAAATCLVAIENKTPIRYNRRGSSYAGMVVGFKDNFVVVRGDNLKRYLVKDSDVVNEWCRIKN